MKKLWIHSITVKLLLFATLSVLISVLGISAFTGIKFYAHLQTEFRAETQRAATESANAIRSTVEFWLSSTSIAMHNIFSLPANDQLKFAESFLGSNTEFVMFQVASSSGEEKTKIAAFTDNVQDVRLQDKIPNDLKKDIITINDKIIATAEKQKQEVIFAPIAQQIGLPLVTIGVRFKNENESAATWGILTVWQTRIQKSLAQNEDSFGVVLNSKKDLLISPRANLDWNYYKDLIGNAQMDSGSARTETADGKTFVNGQATLPDLNMTVAVVKDATSSIGRINYIIANSISWTGVYVLVLLFVCYFAANGITSRLKRTIESTAIISGGNFDFQIDVRGKDEVSDLGRAVNQMAVQIKGLLASKVEAARQEKELETARLVQSTFFPKDQSGSNMFSYLGHNIPASECGGDWWGKFNFGRYEYIIIADATGHGAGAALVTAMAYSGCMTLNEFLVLESDGKSFMSPSNVLQTLNKVLWTAGKGTTSMTCFVGLVDTETGVMTFANGGHCMPVIVSPLGVEVRDYQNAGKAKTVKNRMFSISSRGDPLGFSDTVSYEESVIQLMAGDKILLYTDGFLENFNAEKVPLGKGKFKKLVLSTVDRKGPEMVSELVHSYIDYIGSAAPIDDVTVVVAEVKDDWVEKRKSGAA